MSNVSIFKSAKAPDTAKERPLLSILQGIRDGEWKEVIEKYRKLVESFGKRSMQDKAAKPTLPGFTVSGTFSRRADSALLKHSGFIAIDIDDLYEKTEVIKELLASDKYSYSVFTSTGGAGLCVIIQVEETQHSKGLFEQVEEYYIREYDIQIDFLADISRFRFVSFDPELVINEHSKSFVIDCEKPYEYKPNGELENLTYWTDEEQIQFAEKIVQRDKAYVEGQRHKYILSLSRLLNKLGISEADAVNYINYTYPHFADNPSNAITWVYRNKKSEYGTWKKKTKRASNSFQINPTINPELDETTEELYKSQEITFSFEPVQTAVLVELNEVRFCSIGNIAAIVAGAGSGKSQTCEAIGAAFLNPDCDALGFSVDLPNDGTFLYIDGERTHEDCKRGFMRISKRIDLDNNPELRDGDRMRRFFFHSFIGIGSVSERKEELERIIEETNPTLLLLDDITMIVEDINDNKEADKVFMWLVALANKKGFGIVCTIHPNPKDKEDYKPRGHIGTRVWQKAESVYALIKAVDNKEIRRLTTDFGMGKSRNATDVNEVNYTWNDEAKMFTSCDYEMKVESSVSKDRRVNYSDRLAEIWRGQNNPEFIRGAILLEFYMAGYDVSFATAKRHIKASVELEILEKQKNGKNTVYKFLERIDVPF